MEESHRCCIIDLLLKTPFGLLPASKQKLVFASPRPTPKLLSFDENHYTSYSWVAGCRELQKVVCLPCLIFPFEKSVFNTVGFHVSTKVDTSFKLHETKLTHLKAMVLFKSSSNVDLDTIKNQQVTLNVQQHNEKVTRNRKIIERLILVTAYLGAHKLPLRSSEDDDVLQQQGYYVDTVRLLSQYDELLSNHLDSAAECSGLSIQMQNDLMHSIVSVVWEYIKKEIEKVKFIAVLLIETPDHENVAVFIRYCVERKVHERFIEFVDIQNSTSSNKSKYVFDLLERFSCTPQCIAIFYDGSIIPMGQSKEFQDIINQSCPHILFAHHYAYTVNHLLSQTLQKSNIKECKVFFKTILDMEIFLNNNFSELEEDLATHIPHFSLSPAISLDEIIFNLVEHQSEWIEMFETILDNPSLWKNEIFTFSRAFLWFLNDYDSCFLLCVFSDIFTLTCPLSSVIRYKPGNSLQCLDILNQVLQNILFRRHHFEAYWTRANEMADFIPTRKRLKISNDDDATSWYKGLLFEIIDCITSEIKDRYQYLNNINFIALISPANSKKYLQVFPQQSLDTLTKVYGKFFETIRIRNELNGVYSIEDTRDKDVVELLEFINSKELNSTFVETALFCNLILTLPCCSNSMLPSVSVVNRIKSYCQNAPAPKYYSRLALFYFEQDLLKSLAEHNRSIFVNDVINDMAKYNSRLRLMYK